MLQALVPLVDDLSRELSDSERYRRLLDAMRALLPCDAVALLRLDGDWLVPLAVNGLSRDTLGRRFKIDEHPRFGLLLAAGGWRAAKHGRRQPAARPLRRAGRGLSRPAGSA
jgi:anaerobic nitric oxide reductase transcription regulator